MPPDDNPTPEERQQNRKNTERALSDSGVRIADLRGSLVEFQRRTSEQRVTALQRDAIPEIPIPPATSGSSFQARPFMPKPADSTQGSAPIGGDEIPDVILVINGTAFENCILGGTIGTEV